MEEKKFRQILREHTNETKRHVSVVSESLLKELQAVAEQVSGNSEDITAIKQKARRS